MSENETVELSVILPAYNEGPTIRQAVERYAAALSRCCRDYEILVVNDGSTDDTLAAAQEAASNHPEVRVLTNQKNLGQAASVLRGFAEARGEILMHNGVDLPFDPHATRDVLERVRGGAQVVVVERASRHAYGLVRKAVSWCNIALVRLLLRSPFTDHNFVQAYRRSVIDSITVESRGVSTVTPELILKAQTAGFAVESVTADYGRRRSGRSSITLKRIVHTVRELTRLAIIMRRWRARCAACRSQAAPT